MAWVMKYSLNRQVYASTSNLVRSNCARFILLLLLLFYILEGWQHFRSDACPLKTTYGLLYILLNLRMIFLTRA